MSGAPEDGTRHVVLLGAGHTHAEVVRRWGAAPRPRPRLTCVSDAPVATYSGMLPGVLAGQYPPQLMTIDLPRLCAAAGADLVVGETLGIDLPSRRLLLDGRAPIAFDVLSVGIGSVPDPGGVEVAPGARIAPIKPMRTLLARLDAALGAAAEGRRGEPLRVAVVGGGAGGVEIALALPRFVIGRPGGGPAPQVHLVEAAPDVMPGAPASARRRVRRALARRGIRLHEGRRAVRVAPSHLHLDDGSAVPADLVVWATGAAAPPLLGRLGLPVDPRGFLLTHPTLQTTAGAPVFAVGDAGAMIGVPRPKAGVYAVRQAPVLWDNIGRLLDGRPLAQYHPQQSFLRLINTADGRAIGEWRGWSAEGHWCWRLKDAIDRRFVARYRQEVQA